MGSAPAPDGAICRPGEEPSFAAHCNNVCFVVGKAKFLVWPFLGLRLLCVHNYFLYEAPSLHGLTNHLLLSCSFTKLLGLGHYFTGEVIQWVVFKDDIKLVEMPNNEDRTHYSGITR